MKTLSHQLFALSALLAGFATAEPAPRLNPARFINEISAFGSEVPEKGGIVFTGSSSIRLWTRLKEDFPGLPVLNRGFGGAICNDLIVYFETIVARHEPKLLVTYGGGNDIADAALTVQEGFDDYTKFLTMAHERFPSMRILLTSVKIAPRRIAQVPRVHEFNDRLVAWCVGKDWLRFLDCTSYLADAQGNPIPSFYREDNLHLSDSGYARWKEILDPVLREEWAKVR